MKRRDIIRVLGSAAFATSPSMAALADQSNQNQPNTTSKQLSKDSVPEHTLRVLAAPTSMDQPAIDRGRTPLDRDEAQWKQTVQDFLSLYGPIPQRDANGKLQLPTSHVLDRKLLPQAKLIPTPAVNSFLFTQVELLLNQAADLLDRASQARDQI